MASSRGSSNGPDWKDVTRAAQEYARMWNGIVTVLLRPAGTQKLPTMTVVAQVWAQVADIGVAPPLASASVLLGGSDVMDIDAAALHALYELDKELYRREVGISPIRR